jgi:hypothetical protein
MTLDTFTPTGAPFYDAATISALVTDQLRRIMVDEIAGRIDSATAITRAAVVHAVAMECRADAGLVPRCTFCEDPIEGEPWRNSPPWSQAPYCTSACAMEHAEQVGSRAAWCVKGPHSYGYVPQIAGFASRAAS